MTIPLTPPEDSRLSALRARLSGTRQSADSTIFTCLNTARNFLTWLGDNSMDRMAVDRYFKYRREAGISERTLKKEFYNLQNLFDSNNVPWPFNRMDVPRVKGKPSQPVFSPEQIERLILAQAGYSDAERLYLAIATVWASRREALAQLGKRHWDEQEGTLTIPGVHGSETVKHLIPDEIRLLFTAYRLREHTAAALSYMFNRIMDKAGLDLEDGYGWHSIRRTIATVVEDALPFEKKILFSFSTGWSRNAIGRAHLGSSMAGYYNHPEVFDENRGPYWIDREIYQVHPVLKTWKTALALCPNNQAQNIEDIPITEPETMEAMARTPETAPAVMTTTASLENGPEESELDRLIKRLKQGNGNFSK